jgi:hypothetical protein
MMLFLVLEAFLFSMEPNKSAKKKTIRSGANLTGRSRTSNKSTGIFIFGLRIYFLFIGVGLSEYILSWNCWEV